MNVSRFGKRLAGAGGFINISQSARKVAFAGTFTCAGSAGRSEGGQALDRRRKGGRRSSSAALQQVTFNGSYAAKAGKPPVYYVTERCVFRRDRRGPGA